MQTARPTLLNSAARIASVYLLFSCTWIVVSDMILFSLLDASQIWWAETAKGLLFVCLSAALIYCLTRTALARLECTNLELVKLREQQERAQRVANIGSWHIDMETGELAWSTQTYRIFEVEQNELPTTLKAFYSFVHPEDRIALAKARDAWLKQGGIFSFEHRICTPSGKIKTVVETAELIRDARGRALYTSGVVQDVTEQRQQQSQALTWNRRMQVAAEAANIGIWEYRLDDDELNWDERMFELYGIDPDSFSGQFSDWRNTVHPEEVEEAEAPVQKVLEGKEESFAIEFRIVRPDTGEIRHILGYGKLSCNPVTKEPEVLTGANLDITDWVNTQEQLQQSQKLEAVGQLTGGIAHDFNNHLTVIMNCFETIGEEYHDIDLVMSLAKHGTMAASRSAELTRGLLAFSRKQPLQPVPSNSNKVLTEMGALVRRTLPETISLDFELEPELWVCEVDKGLLQSAILNLTLNARDAMTGGGLMTIRTENTRLDESYTQKIEDLSPGEYVCITVSDTGHGIEAALLEKVFDPFFTTKDTGKGSGLGLSMIYGFVKQSRGHVEIASQSGKGTTVKIFIPRSHDSLSTCEHDNGIRSHLAMGNERILVVEDDDLVRGNLVMQLKKLGYEVVATETADRGYALLAEDSNFDLLVSDAVLPGELSGHDLVDRVTAEYPHIKILFSSGYTEDSMIHSGRLDPGIHFLGKPYQISELSEKVRESLM